MGLSVSPEEDNQVTITTTSLSLELAITGHRQTDSPVLTSVLIKGVSIKPMLYTAP